MSRTKQSGAERHRASASEAPPSASGNIGGRPNALLGETRARAGVGVAESTASCAIGPFTSAGRSE